MQAGKYEEAQQPNQRLSAEKLLIDEEPSVRAAIIWISWVIRLLGWASPQFLPEPPEESPDAPRRDCFGSRRNSAASRGWEDAAVNQ